MLSAEDREQALKWSERQLGNRAGNVSITERDCMDVDSLVEKDGTGIKSRQAEGCHQVLGIMANSAQDVLGEHGRSGCHEDLRINSGMNIKEPTWH